MLEIYNVGGAQTCSIYWKGPENLNRKEDNSRRLMAETNSGPVVCSIFTI